MKVKKFVAPTMPELMTKIRKELGADAVILNSKVVYQGGFLGFFKKKKIEVIAALDPQPIKPKKEAPRPSENKIKTEKFHLKSDEEKASNHVLDEIKDLKKWIQKNSVLQQPSFSATNQYLFDLLVEQEIKVEIAEEIISQIKENADDIDEVDILKSKKLVITELEKRLSKENFGGIRYDKKFVHLVGPTGVGKTTTIAKIAANSVLKDNKKVAFVTTDTYRIAAIDQLKTYSKILDIPLEIAYTLEDYDKARQKFKDYDLVLVDTAGRNFRDEKYINELGKIVDLNFDIDTYLVLSLTTRASDLEDIFAQFKNIPIKQLIFTKKDETNKYGPILNLCLTNDIGVAYITDGQDVPDDIKESSINTICKMIVGEFDE
ncbi:flagellar biosynthesis protein FlhF [Aquibacillus halophilus]|uniref:Flagellar biosynthesis protein FlhF n=1 Tax=Aquibacillus halophilus TaxID=930132 RepID=A0A6A8DH98_9BACI|nr:flagellar biosynthesis protein FlhF [Aquibacillus halophilus]MRH42277.1 flagellar biosynthesis protein FlhF [Aquibacillus halophilus]